jgi:CheY-like chemotaxis protein
VPVDLRDKRVLIVDDHPVNRRILCDHLQEAGMQTCEAGSAFEALDILDRSDSAKPFDLILRDVHMPGMDGFEFTEKLHAESIARSAVIMMITCGDVAECSARRRSPGVAQYIVKPVSKRSLLRAVGDAFHSGPDEKRKTDSAKAPEPAPDSPSLNVLLAEDNLVNQKLVVRLLEKRNQRATVVGNGKDAVAARKRGEFDVILMDVQMPVLDGFAATRLIREWESATGAPRIPIIALTAHALAGDESRCLDAGMDYYLTKPLRSDELRRLLDGIAADRVPSIHHRAPAPPREVPVDHATGDGAGSHQSDPEYRLAKQHLPYPEQHAVDHDAAADPVEQVCHPIAPRMNIGRKSGDSAPAR